MGVSRRNFIKTTLTGGVTASAFGFDTTPVYAETQALKISRTSETRSTCPYCSVSCGVIIHTLGDKAKNTTPQVVHVEGDPDHPINRGTLCPKGASLEQEIHNNRRLTRPQVRRPGSDRWEDISWDDAITRVAQKIRKTRDETWIATEKVDAPALVVDFAAGDRIESAPRFVPQAGGPAEVLVNRTDAIGFMGGAQNTNEECYLFQKAARLLGMPYVEHQARL